MDTNYISRNMHGMAAIDYRLCENFKQVYPTSVEECRHKDACLVMGYMLHDIFKDFKNTVCSHTLSLELQFFVIYTVAHFTVSQNLKKLHNTIILTNIRHVLHRLLSRTIEPKRQK